MNVRDIRHHSELLMRASKVGHPIDITPEIIKHLPNELHDLLTLLAPKCIAIEVVKIVQPLELMMNVSNFIGRTFSSIFEYSLVGLCVLPLLEVRGRPITDDANCGNNRNESHYDLDHFHLLEFMVQMGYGAPQAFRVPSR